MNFKSGSGTRIAGLLVPFVSEVRDRVCRDELRTSETGTSVATPQLGRVVLWMTGALISFSVSALAIRALGQQLNTFEILSIRSGRGLIVLLVLVVAHPALRREL